MSRAPIAALICVAASLAAGPARPAAGTRGQDATAASVQTLLSAGRYDEAETQGRALADEVRRTHGAGSVEAAFASELLVRVLRLNGRAAAPETLSLAERTVQETTARLGPADLRLAPALIGLGDVLVAEAEYPRGLAALEQAVALREVRDGQPGVELAEALDRLGSGLTAAGRHPDAIRVLERSLRIRESAGVKGDVGLARTLEALGWTLQRQGDYERAGTMIRRAASIQESVATDHPDYAATLNLLGLQLWFEGQLTAAKDASTRALAVATRTLRPDHPTTTRALRYLAGVTLDLGDPAQALALFEQALERAERNFGPDHYETGGYLNDVAYTLMWLGEYTAARVKLERALTIAEARFGRWHDRVAWSVDNLADVETRLGDYAGARRLQARAEAIWRRVFGPDHPYVAITLVQQAAVLREQGAPASALPLLERALRIREKRLGPDHRDVALTLADQAATLMQLGQLSRAQELAARAVGIWEKLGVTDAPDMATVYALYADLQARRRDVDAARTYYEKALAIRERVFGRSHPATAEAELGLARALARQGAVEAALARAVSAEATGREHFRLMMRYLPERQALSYAASRPRGLDLTMSLIDVVADGATAAMDGLTRGRALVLDEMAARRAGDPLQTDDPDGLRAALATARQRLANLTVRGPGDLTPAQYTALVDEARRNSELAERTLVDRSATFRAEVRRSQLGLDEVQAALPGGTVLISFLRYERWPVAPAPSSTSPGPAPRGTRAASAYMALVLRPQHPPAAVALGSAATIDRLIHRWRRALAVEPHATGPSPPVRLKPDTTTGGSSSRLVGTQLRRLVWDPMAGHVTGASRLFIVPDGALGLVPFAALPAGSTAYLIDRAPPMHYLSAERDLVSPPAEPATTGRGLLALGGPAFDDVRALGVGTRHRTGTAAPGGSVSSSTRSAPGACDSVETLRFDPLNETSLEAQEVARLWQGSSDATDARPVRLLSGRHASEHAFKNEAPSYRVLHIATHGFFLGHGCDDRGGANRGVGGLSSGPALPAPARRPENPLLLSGLALAGANRRAAAGADQDDGILTAEEVAALHLGGVELAVLSACDTGVGEIKAGEGVFGLRRAFQIAGARTVVMSLWAVDDHATRRWMRALYAGRFQKRLPIADAVHAANLETLRERRAAGRSTHPFYWAAFVAAGDWR